MKVIVFSCMTLLSSCITVTPPNGPPEAHIHKPSTKYQRGPVNPLIPPPNPYNYIAPDRNKDVEGAERYIEDLVTYGQYVRNHVRYVIGKYDLDSVKLKVRCVATEEDIQFRLPPLPDIENVTDPNELNTILIGHLEKIHMAVNKYNNKTISLRDRICVD